MSHDARRSIALSIPKLGDEEWHALRRPIESGWLTQGPCVEEFEHAFAKRHGVAHAVATTSATTALHVALAATGIGPGDEVIVPAFTWVATAAAVRYVGATPVFADVDERTYNVKPEEVERKLSERTRAVVAVHLFGACADMDGIAAVLPADAIVVEDAACAAGADYRGKPAGSLASAGCFSFHPRKSITTGEGGMLTTDDDEIAALARSLRNHGAAPIEGPGGPHVMPEFPRLGFNFRMTDLQAALGLVQLTKLDTFIDERARAVEIYEERLGELDWLRLPVHAPDSRHAWQAYVTVVDESRSPRSRDAIMATLAESGIATRPGTHAVTELQYYREAGVDPGEFPNARMLHRCSMAIPMHNCMTDDDYHYVADTLVSH